MAVRSAAFVVRRRPPPAGTDFLLPGQRAATAITSRSRKGTRSSRLCAMVIRSALTRMSPGSQVLMSTSCMVDTSSRPASSAWSYIGPVTSHGRGRDLRPSAR